MKLSADASLKISIVPKSQLQVTCPVLFGLFLTMRKISSRETSRRN
ncbi:Uncharacterized protein APZ42_020268 [Daphnia magna]|uniref:Uncharacterized protein n=1 Tax=Daphnia magna TaxID=35525 RepID=A0A164XML9_9CRUS|nr:Uncharacterized protein APZ42_020268 [Daphnia magna]